MVVWTLTGMWHGAAWNFVAWGVYYGVILVLEKYVWGAMVDQLPDPVRHIYTGIIVLVGWVFFFSPDLSSAFALLGSMIDVPSFDLAQAAWVMRNYGLMLLICVIGCTPLAHRANVWLSERFGWFRWINPFIYTGVLIVCVAFLIGSIYP